MASATLKERMASLEAEVAALKERLDRQTPQPELPWWKKIVGVYQDDPEFDEAMRLGREYRESLRPKENDGEAVP